MNRTATLIASLTIVSLSACTAQQRHMVQNAISHKTAPATVATAAPTGPTVTAYANCSTVHYEIVDRGDVDASVNIGSQPPYRANVNGDIAVSEYDSTHSFWASVYVGDVKLWETFVDCTS